MDITFNYLDKTVEIIMEQEVLLSYLMDVNTKHALNFTIDRKRDPHDRCLVMCFRTNAEILTENGIETVQPGDCIIHSPEFHQYHRKTPEMQESFRNDWLFVLPGVLSPLMAATKLPWNTLIGTGQPEILAPYIQEMRDELTLQDELSRCVIVNRIEAMLLGIAREYRKIRMFREELSVAERRYFNAFVMLRAGIRENCQTDISIKHLASEVNLSRERFAVLYRRFFGITPYAELLDARLVLAQRLLLNTCMEIKEIVEICGWKDIHYFSRLFKNKIGVPPSLYRRRTSGHE